ncbi:transporter [Corallococcus sp. H22C18031201]|uniref:TSUP family transporter n=1 Tax=Citreicoccus inhibens TaxID=2849499 RepID=UPI000E71C81C|nr:TSUP family transporter [Citreicoccus inhibens]MBU8899104.1 TSUP family transporter [Citreicoccus inhibens]RJS17423.1 transporter [Corallococcus sp. H22C18031201]
MDVDISALKLLLLCLAALCAGLVDAIAGGGGLITLPALLTAGLPVHMAFGTNKGQSVFGSFAAMVRFARAGLVDRKLARVTFPSSLLGALLGAGLLLLVKPEVLKPLVLVLLIAVAIFLAFRKQPQVAERPEPMPHARAQAVGALIALVLGTYDGFFGPGVGTFLIVAFSSLLGHSLARASADAKVVNFASNLASMTLFALKGVVLWRVALPMAAAQFSGAWMGAHLAVKGGDRLVRRVVLGVVVALVLKLGRDVLLG